MKTATHLRLITAGMLNIARPVIRECNICGQTGRFLPLGNPPRPGAACGNCYSNERQRLISMWLLETPISGNILHFAAEPRLAEMFKQRATQYRTADLQPGSDLILNIEDIDLPSESVDIVVCAHVLEHVDDGKALKEIHRILTPQGLAVLLFPIIEGWDETYENPAHSSVEDRIKYYGQADHVRWFGRDVRQRITDAGFRLTEFTAEEPAVSRYGLYRGEKIFIAHKD